MLKSMWHCLHDVKNYIVQFRYLHGVQPSVQFYPDVLDFKCVPCVYICACIYCASLVFVTGT